MRDPQHERGSDQNDQLTLDLHDRAPRFGPDPDDWTRDAEPIPRQPLNGHQPELFPRVPGNTEQG